MTPLWAAPEVIKIGYVYIGTVILLLSIDCYLFGCFYPLTVVLNVSKYLLLFMKWFVGIFVYCIYTHTRK